MPILILAAFLRIGRKYEIDHVRKQAISRLSNTLPSDFQAWCATYNSPIRPRPGNIIKIDYNNDEHLTLVNIIRENDLLVYLPPALYRCVAQDTGKYISIFHSIPDTTKPILSIHDIQLCVQAYKNICYLQATETLSWLVPNETQPPCSSRRCVAIRGKLFRLYLFPSPVCIPFVEWQAKWQTHGLCDECATTSRKSHDEGRLKIWNQLPSVFELPDWEELRLKWSTVCSSCLSPLLD